MWVRSQDKTSLFKENGFKIREHGFEDGTKEYIILGNDNLYNNLGTYKSKKRAIEVLDDIQCFLENNYESDMPQHTNSLYPSYIVCKTYKNVYQMPEE